MIVNHRRGPEQGTPPKEFVEQVRDALKHLYDLPHLQRLPLARAGDPAAGRPGESPGQQLRREIIAAIESLSPGPGTPFHAPHARLYNMLHLHYVEGLTVQEVARELGVSERQTYRDLQRGGESVAAILWARFSPLPPPESAEPEAVHTSSVQAELARLETRPRPTGLQGLLQHAQEAVGRMAAQRAVTFMATAPSEPLVVLTDPVMARQVLVNVLSSAVQQAQPGAMDLALQADGEQTSLTLRYTLEAEMIGASVLNPVVAQLVERLGWTAIQEDRPPDMRTVILHMPKRGPTVLVIDDNEGLVELLERYLTDHACRVVAALSGQEGLRLARELLPDVIILDVMMPEMDGWELLQRMRSYPQMADIPVVICSVFNDPELAYSLGASRFLAKPVSREVVLEALHQLGVL